MAHEAKVKEDKWVPTQCGRCYGACGVAVRKVDGVAVKIQGQPGSTLGSEGGTCAKGTAGLQVLYDPNRLNKPLRRTNPEKGLHADPKWEEITWEEAISEIVAKTKQVMEKDPRRIMIQGTTCRVMRNTTDFLFPMTVAMASPKGTPSVWPGGGGLHCGNGAHENTGMVHASWSHVPDFKRCNYAIYFGANKGSGSGHSAMITARLAAEARSRGMKFVVFDPMANFSGGKASQWVPILPGTDGAVALAIANIIVNDIGVFDEQYIKLKTNGPYLIRPDGRYLRRKPRRKEPLTRLGHFNMGAPHPVLGEDDDNKPLVWDAVDGCAKEYDDPSIKEYALFGEYEVDGVKCSPSFELIKEHLKTYTAEYASAISTVPAKTIEQVAREFQAAAQIGSTITIEGQSFPYRPASAVLFRGGEGHENSHHTCLGVSMLNAIVGNCDVPGGTLGWPARSLGYPGTGRMKFEPYKGVDGMIETDYFFSRLHGPWPPHWPVDHFDPGLTNMFPLAPFTFSYTSSDQKALWQKVGLEDHQFDIMFSYGCNSVMSVANPYVTAESIAEIPFVVVWEIFNTELTEGFADIVLPDTCYLEEAGWADGYAFNFNHAFGMDDWCYHVQTPVVEPIAERRNVNDVVREITDRLGKTPVVNAYYNFFCEFDEDNKLAPDEVPTMTEMCDRVLKHYFGPDKGWEYFKEHGFERWKKQPEEAYWRYLIDARHPIYLEYLLDIGEKVGELTTKYDLGLDLSQYDPLISWFPCTIHETDDPSFDLICFSYRDILHTGSHTMEQPWLDEASLMNPYTYNITINTQVATERGLADGDIIEIQSKDAGTIQGPVKLMQGQHPRTIAIAACSGHWAKGMPIAKNKGVNFDTLMANDLKHVDPVSLNIETAARVKIRKVNGK